MLVDVLSWTRDHERLQLWQLWQLWEQAVASRGSCAKHGGTKP